MKKTVKKIMEEITRTIQDYRGDKTMLAEAIHSSGFNPPVCVKESKLAHEKLNGWLAQELQHWGCKRTETQEVEITCQKSG